MTQATLKRRFLGEVPVYAVAVVWATAVIWLAASKGVVLGFGGIWGNLNLFLATAAGFIAFDLCVQLFRQRPDSPIALARERYGNRDFLARAAACLPLLAVAVVLLPVFSKMKAMIPLFNEYTWDATFIAWDRAVFFGHDAWEVLQPALGYPIVTAAIAALYHLWFLLIVPGVLLFAYRPEVDTLTRRRFFLTYVLSWAVVGGAMATWMASVGPAFLYPLVGNDVFEPQMEYLRAANEQFPVMVLHVQGLLLEWFHADRSGLGSGITAMPSMHVAVAFLYWLATRPIDKRLSRIFLVFFVITWIGSVHTAYHYAVDGLVSVLAVLPLWWLSKPLFKWWDGLLENRAQAALRTNTVPAE